MKRKNIIKLTNNITELYKSHVPSLSISKLNIDKIIFEESEAIIHFRNIDIPMHLQRVQNQNNKFFIKKNIFNTKQQAAESLADFIKDFLTDNINQHCLDDHEILNNNIKNIIEEFPEVII